MKLRLVGGAAVCVGSRPADARGDDIKSLSVSLNQQHDCSIRYGRSPHHYVSHALEVWLVLLDVWVAVGVVIGEFAFRRLRASSAWPAT